MFWLDTNTQQRYYLGRRFTYGGKQYTAAGATAATFNGLGFQQVIVEQKPDERFFFVSGPGNTGAYTTTPRDLDDLKDAYVRKTKAAARKMLRKTDWLVIRKAENADAIPSAVETFRDQVRVVSDDNCTLINGCADVYALEALITAPTEVLSNPGDLTSAMITNPDPHLAEYPDEVDGYDY